MQLEKKLLHRKQEVVKRPHQILKEFKYKPITLKNISMFHKERSSLAHIIVEHFFYEKLYLEAKYKGKTFSIYIVFHPIK